MPLPVVNPHILDPFLRSPSAAVVIHICWPLAFVIMLLVLRMLFNSKLTFLNLRFVIPVHFFVEFLFTVSFIQLSVEDMGFRLTLALHGLTDCMFAFCMLFRRSDAQRLFKRAMIAWTITTLLSAILYYPLDIVVGGSMFVVPMDCMTFLGSVAVVRRSTNARARLCGYCMMGHMVMGFIIFSVFLSKSDFAYPLIINACHVLLCCLCWAPIAQMSDAELVSQGVTPPLEAADGAKADVEMGSSSDEPSSPKAPSVTATDLLSPTRLEKPMHAFLLGGTLLSTFFLALLIGIFVSYRTSFWDLVESPFNYYSPGLIGAI